MRKHVVVFVMALSATLASIAGPASTFMPRPGGPPPVEFPVAGINGPSLAHLAAWMAGSFSSAEQAAADSSYFDIRLHMEPIWEERSDGPWLYVEQAVATSLERPYRQRVYHVTEPEAGLYVSEVYELPGDPLRFAGAWQADSLLAGVTPEQLTARQGCAVHLRWRQESRTYEGRTPGTGCLSSLRGASYATSEVSISCGRIVSWDRGWDDHDLQVWGAEKGGYDFLRVHP